MITIETEDSNTESSALSSLCGSVGGEYDESCSNRHCFIANVFIDWLLDAGSYVGQAISPRRRTLGRGCLHGEQR
jgi:hypothetical protein